MKQVECFGILRHVQLIYYSIVMEYADGGDIFQMIKRHQKEARFIDEDEIWKAFIQCVRGLKVLHDMKIMHRDLKVKFLT